MNKLISGLRFLTGYLQMVRDPRRLDVVFRLIDGVRTSDSSGGVTEFFKIPEVKALMESPRPALRLYIDDLRRLPEGSLGRVYATFLDSRGLDLESLYRLHKREDEIEPADRVAMHLERSHDIWHVVTGFGTDIAGEIGLQAFYSAQMSSPVAAAVISAALLNGIVRDPKDLSRRMEAIADGWRLGRGCESLVGADWATLVLRPLEEVRASFGITPEMVAIAAGGGDPPTVEAAA